MMFENTQILIVVECNVANSVYFISKKLQLALIGFNVVLKHLLQPKINFKMMAVFLELLGNVSLIDFMAHTNIFCKRIIGTPKHIQSVTHWGKKKLHREASHKVFVPAKVTDNLQ